MITGPHGCQKCYSKHFVRSRFSSVQPLSRVQLFATLWTEACQASLSFTSSRSLLKLMSIELVLPWFLNLGWQKSATFQLKAPSPGFSSLPCYPAWFQAGPGAAGLGGPGLSLHMLWGWQPLTVTHLEGLWCLLSPHTCCVHNHACRKGCGPGPVLTASALRLWSSRLRRSPAPSPAGGVLHTLELPGHYPALPLPSTSALSPAVHRGSKVRKVCDHQESTWHEQGKELHHPFVNVV